jgi:flagellar biosynthesis GTPase FlhF
MKVEDYIKQHKHVNYCEALIFPNGDIIDARPSHVEALIKEVTHDYSLSREQLAEMMPNNASPLHWIIDRYNYGCIWYNSAIVSVDYTEAILNTIQKLIDANILQNVFRIDETDEYKRCKILNAKELDEASLFALQKQTFFLRKN